VSVQWHSQCWLGLLLPERTPGPAGERSLLDRDDRYRRVYGFGAGEADVHRACLRLADVGRNETLVDTKDPTLS